MNKGTIDLEGVVGWEMSARSVKRQLKDMGEVDEIDVYMNSPGGYIDEGFGIFTALKNNSAKINMHITGMAASMGSVIAMAGDTVTIEPTGMMMIHPPASIAWGTAVEMRKEADVLDKYESRLITAYKRRDLNLSDDELKEAVADETWYTAEEALEAGFVDGISDGAEEQSQASNSAIEWLRVAKYKNAPESIARQIKTNRVKANALKQELISSDGSAVHNKTEGTTMTNEVEVSDADIKAKIKVAVDANESKWVALLSHDNASNTAAVIKIASMNLDAENSASMMDLVATNEVVAAPVVNIAVEPEAEAKPDLQALLTEMIAKNELNNVNTNTATENEPAAPVAKFDAEAEHKRIKEMG